MSETLSHDQFDSSLPFERAEPIPSACLTNPEFYKKTCERVFLNSWQVVARGDELAQPGSFVTVNIAQVPVLIWRGQDGVLRAMHNVCEHQGYGPLEGRAEGMLGTTLVCPNHRATYKCTGKLHAMPKCENIEELKTKGVGLRPYAVESFGPLVAVHLGDPKESFREILSPLPERHEEIASNMRFHKRFTYEVPYGYAQANKNYLDHCSHCPSVHPEFASCVDLEKKTCETFRFASLQHVPAGASSGNDVRAGDKNYYWFWPNFTFNFNGDGTFDTNRFVPLSPDRCLVINDTYHDGTKTDAFMEESNRFMDRVQAQDNKACTGLQKGSESPHFDRGFYSIPNDVLIYHFHCLLASALEQGNGK